MRITTHIYKTDKGHHPMRFNQKLLLSLVFGTLFLECTSTQTPQTDNTNNKAGKSSAMNTALYVNEGFVNAYSANVEAAGKPFWCESSAILFDGQKIFMATDKDMPNAMTSVFYWNTEKDLTEGVQASNLYDKVFKNSIKYEDFAMSPDGKMVFLSTGFDRVKTQDHEWDGYNTIYYWEKGQEYAPQVLSTTEGPLNSVALREIFSKAIGSTNVKFPNGVPYFKIEGLAVTDTRMFFGVREEGQQFDDFEYKIKILSVPYTIKNVSGVKKVEFSGKFEVVADFNPVPSELGLQGPLGLSSIEYDRFNKRFLILTSFEKKELIGAYLWTASESDVLKNQPFTLVKTPDGKPFAFTHKAEDITMLDAERALVIADDDRFPTVVKGQIRLPNQAAYAIIKFK